MKQEIYRDEYELSDWDLTHSSRCFVNICNSMSWKNITGKWPATIPLTAKAYTNNGLPWFDYYDDTLTALKGRSSLNKLKSVVQFSKNKKALLPENESVTQVDVVKIRKGLKPGQVREWMEIK